MTRKGLLGLRPKKRKIKRIVGVPYFSVLAVGFCIFILLLTWCSVFQSIRVDDRTNHAPVSLCFTLWIYSVATYNTDVFRYSDSVFYMLFTCM